LSRFKLFGSSFLLYLLICFSSLTIVFPHILYAQEKKLALALSGGGAKGFAHIGVLLAFEEARIPIDAICGVSMGAVIGAFYAIGYDAETLRQIALDTEWASLYNDSPTRDMSSLEEKRDFDRYLTSFPIKGGRIEIPQGISAGQNIGQYLSRLSWPVHHINDFSQFAIPFSAVATNLLTGEPEQFTQGYLADVLQASMTIPSFLMPVEINGQLYLDGGVSRNLPVDFAKKMGGDVVIAIDVTADLYTLEELNSGMRIVDQSISFRGFENTKMQRKLADLLIRPDVNQYGNSSFSQAFIDSIIQEGYNAAKSAIPQIKALIDGRVSTTPQKVRPFINDSLYISEIQVAGAKQVSESFVLGKLGLRTPRWMTALQIEDAIDRVYATRYFQRVNYRLFPLTNNRTKLIVQLAEQSLHTFNIGIHYNDYTKATLLLNVSYRNLFRQNSKLTADLLLSENPGFTLNYYLHTSWKPGIGVETLVLHRNFQLYQYEKGRRIGQNELHYSGAELALRSTLYNSLSVSAALRQEYAVIQPIISPIPDADTYTVRDLNSSISINYDSFDDLYFPTKGARLMISFSWINQIQTADTSLNFQPYEKRYLYYSDAAQISNRFTLSRNMYAGSISSQHIPPLHRFHLGGMSHFQELTPNYFPFAGFHFMELQGSYFLVMGACLRYEMWKNNFLLGRFDWGNTHQQIEDFYEFSQYKLGTALTFAYNSPAGPMSITIMRSSMRPDYITFVNLGYQF
jgi:NTE family protein